MHACNKNDKIQVVIYMKDKYLIVLDLDGTLLQGFDQYDLETFAYLKQLAKQHTVVLATGRPYRSSKYYYDLLELTTPIINYNGSLVHHPSDSKFKKQMHTVNKHDICNFLNELDSIFVNAFCEIEDSVYLFEDTKEMIPYLHLEGGTLTIGPFLTTLPSDPHGAILVTKEDSEEALLELSKKYSENSFHLRIWHNDDLVISEVYSLHVNKATGIKTIQEALQIQDQKVIAIGDGHNDIEMIQYADIGVAMANGHEELLEVANYITSSLEEQGVMRFLKQFFKSKGQ